MKELVSVIITSFKTDGKLERAIDSVLKQTYKNIEIIVVDDNNPDTSFRALTEKIMEKYCDNDKVIYLRHEKNMNGSAARNTGLKASKGKYIAFLDDDDFFLPTKVKTCVNILQKEKKYAGVYTSVLYMNDDKYYSFMKPSQSGNLQKALLTNNNMLGTGSNIFIRSECMEYLKAFDIEFLRFQDVEFMVRFFEKFEIKHLEEILVVKDTTGLNKCPSYSKMKDMVQMFFTKFRDVISKYDDSTQKRIHEAYYTILFNIALLSKERKLIKEATLNLKEFRELSKVEKIKKMLYPVLTMIPRIRKDVLDGVSDLLTDDDLAYLKFIQEKR